MALGYPDYVVAEAGSCSDLKAARLFNVASCQAGFGPEAIDLDAEGNIHGLF